MSITWTSTTAVRAAIAVAAMCAGVMAAPAIAADAGTFAPQLAVGVERMADGGAYWLAESLIPLKRDLMLASGDGAFKYGVERHGTARPRLVGKCSGVVAFDDASTRHWSRQIHCGHAQYRMRVLDLDGSSAS